MGNIWLSELSEPDSAFNFAIAVATFDSGARLDWHTHPSGQILLITEGTGYYQEKGQPKKVLRKGDAVKCPPNVPHWHGASKDSAFVQVAITNNHLGATVWLEEVTDEEYNGQ